MVCRSLPFVHGGGWHTPFVCDRPSSRIPGEVAAIACIVARARERGSVGRGRRCGWWV